MNYLTSTNIVLNYMRDATAALGRNISTLSQKNFQPPLHVCMYACVVYNEKNPACANSGIPARAARRGAARAV